ncbi:MAG: ABC transporter substrate-binding protein [Gemmatimonadetes bacterium]|nr:ABC transporter substrate-binding protein [Gemmatimonadota bacterium]MYE95347.1 ABC transporter substrate-binding protein [Gemmatimonadota bacterium]MYJ09291.1 ABC transporter substrate-binding protein [Gemmatimonadota bacterium]
MKTMDTGSPQRVANATVLAGLVLACAASVSGPTPQAMAETPQEAPVIGALLPMSGSPSSQEYARMFLDGVEVAVDLARRAGVNVQLVVEDNGGTPSGSVRGVSALVDRGAVAILGPLAAGNVSAASEAAPRRLPFFSPTARDLPDGQRGVYSMGAGNPAAGLVLADAATGLGYFDAVVVHPRSPGETLEATAFAEAFRAVGGAVRRRIEYLPGTTTFEVPLLEAKSLAPRLLVVAAAPSDIELLAPQIAFFGLDTIGVQVAGTAGWTGTAVMEGVARRHTDGVISVSPLAPDAVEDLPTDFVEAYERRFRRSLHSMVPATGFDLFRMALAAYGAGRRTSGDLVAALERLHRFAGVTGSYSFADGRLTREYFPVRIYGGSLHPVDTEFPEAGQPGPAGPRPHFGTR